MIKKIISKIKGWNMPSLGQTEGKTVIYISGPMTGLPGFNKSTFFEVAAELKMRMPDAVVLNPAVLPSGLTHEEYMKICLPMAEIATHLYMLRGWKESKGAKMELEHAWNHGNIIQVFEE